MIDVTHLIREGDSHMSGLSPSLIFTGSVAVFSRWITSAESVRAAAGRFHWSSSGLRAPTRNEVTAGCCLTQANATFAIG